MPAVHRRTDLTTGHDCWVPTIPQTWSADVFANNLNVVRRTDEIVPHTCPAIPETHGSTYSGTSTVYVNNRAIQVVGSPVACGDGVAQGSPDVFAGRTE